MAHGGNYLKMFLAFRMKLRHRADAPEIICGSNWLIGEYQIPVRVGGIGELWNPVGGRQANGTL